ncbi:MAG TPA: hypothetical protein VGJ32_02975, partial [Solirubrobacteraceae bacterium]
MTDAAAVAATLLGYVRRSGALGASAVVEDGTIDVDADGSASLEPAGSPMAEPLDPTAAEPLELGLAVRELPP